MKCNRLFVVIVILFLSFLKPYSVFADGMFLSDEQEHLYLPEQKAIIGWDSGIEQMILSSKVKADRISNMVWVIPIQSKSKPEVSAANFSIFKDLVSYFSEEGRLDNTFTVFKKSRGLDEGIEVIERVKVDIYDIAILKTTCFDDLYEWLNDNGYSLSEDAKVVFDKYIKQPNMYFVANKINLGNKFYEESQQAKYFYNKIKQELEQMLQHMDSNEERLHIRQQDFCPTWNTVKDSLDREKEFSLCVINKIVSKFQQMGKDVETVAPSPHFPNVKVFSIDGSWTVHFADFERLENSYFFIRHDNKTVLTDNFPRADSRRINTRFVSPMVVTEAKQYADTIRTVISDGLKVKKSLDLEGNHIYNQEKDISELLSFISRYNKGEDAFFCNILGSDMNFLRDSQRKIMKEILSKLTLDYEVNKDSEYCRTVANLSAGIATPLKISFQPDRPYYPLEISSLGKGWTTIEVYVIGRHPVFDQNEIFNKAKTLVVDAKLNKKIVKEFRLGQWAYVTRFTWRGDLKDLNKDAIFFEQE